MDNGLSIRSLFDATSLPLSEARILMAHVIDIHYQLPRSALLSQDNLELNETALEKWKSLELKRLQGEPVAYLIGKKGFHNIELYVAPGVLIPRPETELLVEIGLNEIKCLQGRPRILDLGTGSGAIALAIAQSTPNIFLIAADLSPKALEIAKINAERLHLTNRVQFLESNWYSAFTEQEPFDIILSNPPYIPIGDPHLSQEDLRFEPISSLTDEANGLTCLEIIIKQAADHLKPSGLIAVEHGFDQFDAVKGLMQSANMVGIVSHTDLSGHQRVTSARRP